jgi:hypothetical protein
MKKTVVQVFRLDAFYEAKYASLLGNGLHS